MELWHTLQKLPHFWRNRLLAFFSQYKIYSSAPALKAFSVAFSLAPSTMQKYRTVWKLFCDDEEISLDIFLRDVQTGRLALEVVYIWLHRGISNQIYSAATVLGYVTAFHKA